MSDEPQTDEAAPEAQDAAEDRPAPDFAHLRMAEALLFAAAEPLDVKSLEGRMPDGVDVPAVLEALQKQYEGRGVELAQFGKRWAFRTATDLGFLMEKEREDTRRLSRAAVETLAIIAYHQPVTRAEVEEIRGVAVSKGTLDVLLETGWVRMRGRRRTPGRPVTYGTSDEFLQHFGLSALTDLPGMEELKAAGLLDSRLPPGFEMTGPALGDEEDPLDDDDAGDVSDMIASTLDPNAES